MHCVSAVLAGILNEMSTAKPSPGAQRVKFEEVPVAGKLIRLVHSDIPVDQLELDPDNPRIRYRLGINPGTDAKQELLGWRDVVLLRKDIERSGGLRERIVVQFDRQSKTYKVREGNCRTVCYSSLHEKEPTDKRWLKVPARVLPENVDPRAVAILLADWQVVGKIEWKAHEKAAQIFHMHQKLKMSMDEIAMHMRASKTTIQRQLDAHGALTEKFFVIDEGKYAAEGEGKWSFFEELFKSKELRERLRGEPDALDEFCRWVGEGRLRVGADVRLLPKIFANEAALSCLRGGNAKSAFAAAKQQLAKSDPSIGSDFFKLLAKVREAVTSAAQVKEIIRLRADEVARQQILETHHALLDFMALAGVEPASGPKVIARRSMARRVQERRATRRGTKPRAKKKVGRRR